MKRALSSRANNVRSRLVPLRTARFSVARRDR